MQAEALLVLQPAYEYHTTTAKPQCNTKTHLQVKSQDAVHTLGSQCVYTSEIFKPYHLPRRVKLAKYVNNITN